MLALVLSGCGEDAIDSAPHDDVSSAPQSPGALPTHEISFQLLSKEKLARFEHIQLLFEQRGERCGVVLSATLMGGINGMDEWRVKCADTGEWEIWLKPVGHDILPRADQQASIARQRHSVLSFGSTAMALEFGLVPRSAARVAYEVVSALARTIAPKSPLAVKRGKQSVTKQTALNLSEAYKRHPA